jgi:hypothetical protein
VAIIKGIDFCLKQAGSGTSSLKKSQRQLLTHRDLLGRICWHKTYLSSLASDENTIITHNNSS